MSFVTSVPFCGRSVPVPLRGGEFYHFEAVRASTIAIETASGFSLGRK